MKEDEEVQFAEKSKRRWRSEKDSQIQLVRFLQCMSRVRQRNTSQIFNGSSFIKDRHDGTRSRMVQVDHDSTGPRSERFWEHSAVGCFKDVRSEAEALNEKLARSSWWCCEHWNTNRGRKGGPEMRMMLWNIMKYFEHLITVPHQNSTLQNCPTVCDTRDAWEGPRRLSRLSAPAKAKTARSLEKAQADAIQARDGKRWQEMARDGKRWQEMARDGKRSLDSSTFHIVSYRIHKDGSF